ncbi:flagellar protein FliT [Brevibacillus borstelensis]|uniref:flagellar protein FliT n=1 Tax=Brevibacillus borstelensis TaxID=45462 RepID=UPI0030C3AB9F
MAMDMDAIVKQMLQLTTQLEQTVSNSDSEPDEWLLLLDERQKLMKQLDEGILTGEVLSDGQKMLLVQIDGINQRIQPVMLERKQGVEKKLKEIQHSKTAVDAYHEAGPSAYGAFFDSKK